MTDIHYTPADRDAARPEDLKRKRTPRPAPALLGEVQWPDVDPSSVPFIYIGQALTPTEFRAYVDQYDFGSLLPSWVIFHHTWNPDASWAPISSNQATWWDRDEAGKTIEQ